MDRFYKKIDHDLWVISADTVNAMYNPQMNSIVFPAAILQEPFYSLSQSESANYGGIGAVIAHEISHAFDPNGAKFDENGAMTDWWLPEDYAKFEELSQRMVEAFDGLPYKGFAVNGRLTLGENVADAGGLGCALQVVQSLPEPDLQAFFINWATIWRQKVYDQVVGIMITVDTHAPNKIRANLQPAMLDAFYEAFDIVEGDPMYRAPEDRVAIW
jgi:putative endopeptidase